VQSTHGTRISVQAIGTTTTRTTATSRLVVSGDGIFFSLIEFKLGDKKWMDLL